ncbi:GerAB/ArcD/ProY family transporter [Phosphitispora sp. TUW77]|uniref:GerAB/ArcD/ProY family transporter n=1 Tax=Phosphitispora sp. TUW77 TaxID=3152361 RepID=UPI003AB7C243
MKINEKVSSTQMMFLMVTSIAVTGFLYAVSITSAIALQDAWMSAGLGATLIGLLIAFVCAGLGLYYPDNSIVEYAPELIGKIGGKVIGLLYILSFMHMSAIIVREFGDFLVTLFLPETPLVVFNLIIVLLAAYAIYNGMEVLCRINQLIFPFFIGAFIFVALFFYPEVRFYNFLPVLENGIKPVLFASLIPGMWRGEMAVILMFLPFMNQPRETLKTLIIADILIGLLLTLSAAVNIAVLGPLLAKNMVRFLEQLQPLVFFMWIVGMTIKLAVFYLASVLGAAQWLNIKDYRSVIFPLGIFILVYSFALFENSAEMVAFLAKPAIPYMYIFELIIPMALLAIAFIRKKRGHK